MSESDDERIEALEKRVARAEKNLRVFQKTVVKKLTETLNLIQKHQRLRDARVNQQLQRIVLELASIREKIDGPANPSPSAMN